MAYVSTKLYFWIGMLITLLPQGLALDASGVVREDTFASQKLATPKLTRGTPSTHLGRPDPDAFEKLRRGIPSTHLGQPDAASEFEKDLPKGFPFSKEGDPEPLEALARFQAARSDVTVLVDRPAVYDVASHSC